MSLKVSQYLKSTGRIQEAFASLLSLCLRWKAGKHKAADCSRTLSSLLKILRSLVLSAVTDMKCTGECLYLRLGTSSVFTSQVCLRKGTQPLELEYSVANCVFLQALIFCFFFCSLVCLEKGWFASFGRCSVQWRYFWGHSGILVSGHEHCLYLLKSWEYAFLSQKFQQESVGAQHLFKVVSYREEEDFKIEVCKVMHSVNSCCAIRLWLIEASLPLSSDP